MEIDPLVGWCCCCLAKEEGANHFVEEGEIDPVQMGVEKIHLYFDPKISIGVII